MSTPSQPEKNANLSKKAKCRARRKTKSKEIQMLQMPNIEQLQNFEPKDDFDDDPMYQDIMNKFLLSTHPQAVDSVPGNDIEKEESKTNSLELDNLQISKQKLKKYGRPSIGQLKVKSSRPDLIERNDTNSPEPFALIALKSCRNAVPMPSHWNQKKRYLDFKRGSEISRYRLPIYLEKTGIPQMRKALLEAEQSKSIALKQRERVRPKVGQFDISSDILISAFFNQQTKPFMSRFGELYYEGAEFVPDPRKIRPGKISQALRNALGMTEGMPPPWLRKMQQHGPPPSYPHLKIPGLNAPLPKGAHWGTDSMGWGNVPINQNDGTPIFGGNPYDPPIDDEVDREKLWGELDVSDKIMDGVNI